MPLDPEDSATTARDLMLDRMWATAPGASVQIGALNASGVELDPADCPGYARFTVSSWGSLWLAASGGAKLSNPISFGTPTAEWTDAGYSDAIFVDGYMFDSDLLVDPLQIHIDTPLVVTAAGDPTVVTLVRAFDGLGG